MTQNPAASVNYVRFAMVYFLATIAIAIIGWALETYANLSIGSATAIIAPMAAALDTGQKVAQQTGEAITGRPAWRVAAKMTGIIFVISIVLAAPLFLASPMEGQFDTWASDAFVIIAVVAIVLLLAIFLTCRYFVSFGGKNFLKAKARIDRK